jgi:starch synthase
MGGIAPLRIFVVTPELVPLAKTSEVANVVASLCQALRHQGHDVRLAMPHYAHMRAITSGAETVVESLAVPMNGRTESGSVLAMETPDGLPVYLLSNARYFADQVGSLHVHDADPFVYFCRAVIELLRHPDMAWRPEVIHCHDWQTALVPNLLRTVYAGDPLLAGLPCVLTVHRLSHQGIFGYRVLEAAGIKDYGFIYYSGLADLDELVVLLGRGIYYSDAVTTVSEHYAQEIQTPEFGEQLDPLLRDCRDRLFGIRNGIDIVSYDAERDPLIAAPFAAASLDQRAANKRALQRLGRLALEPDAPLLAMITRLNDLKGVDLLLQAAPWLLDHLGAQLFVVGTGEQKYHDALMGLCKAYPGRLAVHLSFEERLQHQVFAGADMFLMPSRIEPCGLGQMIALHYGALPIVRATGGLADIVHDYEPATESGNGFVFGPSDAVALYTAMVRAVEAYRRPAAWRAMQTRGLQEDYSWDQPARQYLRVYQFARGQRQAAQAVEVGLQ